MRVRVTSVAVALALAAGTLSGCGAPGPTTGTVTGTVYLAGRLGPGLAGPVSLSAYRSVVAWRRQQQMAATTLKRRGGWIAFGPDSPPVAIGTYRMTLHPGRYVLEPGTSPPAGDVSANLVEVAAGTTIKKDLYLLFHGLPGPSP
ncbi:MAG TPA: hypothetical protein VKR22_08460 [Acidimicrobiales bacterium]|nr:hypothetical protein [Acidimicrobiales bacterium]